jgi:hypothetical protein
MSKYYGLDKFQAGDRVRIKSLEILQEFTLHPVYQPLQESQFKYADKLAVIAESSMYHGGNILYQLKGVPGIWHQDLLLPA